MRRRHTGTSGPAVPERLCRFVAAEWPEDEPYAALRSWQLARQAWVDAHGSGTELGNPLDVVRGHREARIRLAEAGLVDPRPPGAS